MAYLATILVGIFVMSASLFGDVSASHSLAPIEGYLGDDYAYQLRVTMDADADVEPLSFDDQQWGVFVIKRSASDITTLPNNSGLLYVYDAVVTTFELEDTVWPTVNFTVVESGRDVSVTLPSLSITIKRLVNDQNTGIRPMKGLMKLAVNPVSYMWAFAALLAAAVIGGYGYFRWRRRQQVSTEVFVSKQVLPLEEAVSALDVLWAKNLIQEGRVQDHYFYISEIIKRFFERVYSVSLMELTTTELMTELSPRLGVQPSRRLQKLLEFGDLAKFAKFQPTIKEHETVFNDVKHFLEEAS